MCDPPSTADIHQGDGYVSFVAISAVTLRLGTFLERAIKREAGPNTRSCTNLWGSNCVLV